MEHVTLEIPQVSEGAETATVINGQKVVFKIISVSPPKKEVIAPSDAQQSQKEVIESLYGAWPIDETADELIDRIKKTRKSSDIVRLEE